MVASSSHHTSRRHRQRLERDERPLRLIFLNESQQGIEHNDGRRIDPFLKSPGDACRSDKNPHDHAGKLPEKHREREIGAAAGNSFGPCASNRRHTSSSVSPEAGIHGELGTERFER